jgi:FkbM family methyltransferase
VHEYQGWWFPDAESHFPKMLKKSIDKGGPAEYQYQVRDRSMTHTKKRGVALDIGANVGLYSCYAAKSRRCFVYSFEPSVFNLELLARNIYLNNLVDRITIVPLSLSNILKQSTFNMTSTEWGGALSTFGENFGDDGNEIVKVFDFCSIGIPMDNVVSSLNIPLPSFIKMDVDGLEHLILSGDTKNIPATTDFILRVAPPTLLF